MIRIMIIRNNNDGNNSDDDDNDDDETICRWEKKWSLLYDINKSLQFFFWLILLQDQ